MAGSLSKLIRLFAQGAAKSTGTKVAQTAAPQGFMGLLKESIVDSLPSAATTTLFSLPYYLTAYDPKEAIGLAAVDTAGSLLAGGLLGAATTRLRGPRPTQLAINPEYQQKLDLLGVQPGATAKEINAAKAAVRKQIIKDHPDLREGINSQSEGARRIRELTETANQLKQGVPHAEMFIQQAVPSKLAGFAQTGGDVAFGLFGMPAIEKALAEQGLITNKYNDIPQQKQTPQSDIINQQLESRVAQNTGTIGPLSPGTMYQLQNYSPLTVPEEDTMLLTQNLLQQAMQTQQDTYNELGVI